jgi:hypothetical protein
MTLLGHDDSAASPDTVVKQKAYTTPQLHKFGTLHELTQAVVNSGSDNNPGMPNGSVL